MERAIKERIIFSNVDVDENSYIEDFKSWCKDWGYDENEEDLSEFVQRDLDSWLDAEYANLNVECGDILVIADLGFWNGRRSGYRIIRGNKLKHIFSVIGSDYEYYKFYCDRYDVKAELHHHDGTHYLTFREIKPKVNINKITEKLYNQEEVERKEITRYTKSLNPYLKKIYGW